MPIEIEGGGMSIDENEKAELDALLVQENLDEQLREVKEEITKQVNRLVQLAEICEEDQNMLFIFTEWIGKFRTP
jgi:hypothetical protein